MASIKINDLETTKNESILYDLNNEELQGVNGGGEIHIEWGDVIIHIEW